MSVAFVAMEDDRIGALQRSLDLQGCRTTRFSSVPDLLAVLGRGLRFGLLMLALQDEMANAALAAVCEVLQMPAFFQEPQPQGRWCALWPAMDKPADRHAIDLHAAGKAEAELDRRIGRLLRSQDASGTSFAWRDFRFLPGSNIVMRKERPIQLQPRQFAFALALFRNIGEVLTRESLWGSLWDGVPQRDGGRALDVCAANVRKRLGLRRENGVVLVAVYRTGYQLVAVPHADREGQGERPADGARGPAASDPLNFDRLERAPTSGAGFERMPG